MIVIAPKPLILVALLAFCSSVVCTVRADTLYWDPDMTPPANGGSGTWDLNSTANWATNPAADGYVTWQGGNGTEARLMGANGTITVSGVVTAEQITVDHDMTGGLLTGGTIETGPSGLRVLHAHEDGNVKSSKLTIESKITGSNGLLQESTGGDKNRCVATLVLSNPGNDFTGDVVIDSNMDKGEETRIIVTNEAALGPGNEITLRQNGAGMPRLVLDYTGTFSHTVNFVVGGSGYGRIDSLYITSGNTIEIADASVFGGTRQRRIAGPGEMVFTFESNPDPYGYGVDDGKRRLKSVESKE